MRFVAIGAVTVCIAAACAPSLPVHTVSPTVTPTVVPINAPTPTPAPTATPSPAPTPSGVTAASLRPESVTFISPDDGWVLGLSLCGRETCLQLAKTVNAGNAWSWVSSENVSSISASEQWQLRFADSNDGWISGPGLYSTHDAGRIWTGVELPALDAPNGSVGALETADGRVYAEIAAGTEPNTYGSVVLFGSRTNSDGWYSVPSVTTGADGSAGNISVAEGVFWISLHPAIVTAQGDETLSTLYRSVDGITWRSEPQPCPPQTVATVGAATSARVFVVCAGGVGLGSEAKTAYVSSDDGAVYERVTDPPFGGDFDAVAASPTSVSVVASSGASEIDTSFDDGRTWAATLASGDGGLGFSDVGFTTAIQGVAIHGQTQYPDSLQLFMTRDGGRQWSPVNVNPS